MPYLIVDNFKSGLDTRRHVLNGSDGTLADLTNAHITRGGEIEKRKAFVQHASLPANTFGLEATLDTVYVFGSIAPPSMPMGVTYQRLQHPDGLSMTKVVWSTVYGGLPFVIAEYSNGDRMCFWDGAIVRDWFAGKVRLSMANNDGIAAHLVSDFDLDGYSISRTGSVITITGPSSKSFDVSATATSPQTATVALSQSSGQLKVGKKAVGYLTISGVEKASNASRKFYTGDLQPHNLPDIKGIYVNGVEITGISSGSAIRYDDYTGEGDSIPRLCLTLSTYINLNTPSSGFRATYKVNPVSGSQDNATLTIWADSELGSDPNGWVILFETIAPANSYESGALYYLGASVNDSPFNTGRKVVTFGTLASGEFSGISSVKVDGVKLFDDYIPWKVSNTTTMDNVVTAINDYTSTPEFVAYLDSGRIMLEAAVTGDQFNGMQVTVDTLGQTSATAIIHMAGGVDDVPGNSQQTTVTIGGTFTPGANVSITVTDPDSAYPYRFGASRVTGKIPSFSVTYKGKEYAAVGSTMYFSALNDATKWDIYDTGSGFIDMSNNFGGREELTGFGVYQNKMAVFSRRNVQLWFLDVDPARNSQDHILANTGAISPDSVVSMGSIDVMYLSDSGIRSLRARENTDTAFANDIGSPIDSIVVSHLASLTEEQKLSARAIVEPNDGRYWLSIGDKIYVLSYFPGASILGWSVYEPGFSISEMVTQFNKVFVRSGNTVYLYGGSTGSVYDDCEVTVELPYLDAKKPATYKAMRGIDCTVEGLWKVECGFDHTNQQARDVIARVDQPTFAIGKVDANGLGTHFGFKLTNEADGYAKLACLIVHYDDQHSKHDAG